MDRSWIIRPRAPENFFTRYTHLPWPVAQLLYNRGLREPEEIEAFLARRVENVNPFEMHGMYEAVKRIRQAIASDENVLVHGDFDADGVTSTAVMVTGLQALGARVAHHIPHRVDEGYGLNAEVLYKMKERGFSLMVTVDCGIRAHEEIALANELGIDVIVTDHHSPGELPPAHAIVNPHQEGCRYPYKSLAGVGLAWKTVQALWLAEGKRPLGKSREALDPEELLDLVALGTVADVAPLIGENRKLVWKGIERLRQTRRPGLLALMERAGIHPRTADTETIGFVLGPRINAAGRLAHARLAYHLLRTNDPVEAQRLARELEEKNTERRELTLQALIRAHQQLTEPDAPLLIVSDQECPEGIIGLVAGRLTDKFYRPSIVISQGPEWSRASCRSIPEFHITHALDQVGHLLERYGGHAAAAGFTVRTEQLPALEAALLAVARQQFASQQLELTPRLVADGELPLHEVDQTLADALDQLAPFGQENHEPIWISRRVVVDRARPVGRGGSHLQLALRDQQGRPWHAIAFRQGERAGQLPGMLDIAFTLKRSEWQGRERLELQLSDFRSARD